MAGSLASELPEVCDLVGFSLGAKLALKIASRRPKQVRRMVLGGIGDNALAPESVGEAAAHALEQGFGDDAPPPVRAFLATWDPELNDPLAIAAVLRRPPNPVFRTSGLAAIRTPLLVVNGSDDFVATMGTRLFEALRVEQVLLPDTGHFDLTAQPAFRDLAIGFLED